MRTNPSQTTAKPRPRTARVAPAWLITASMFVFAVVSILLVLLGQ